MGPVANRPWVRLAGASLVLAGPVLAEPQFVQNGTAGFVVTDIKYALAQGDKAPGEVAGACPHGMSLNWAEIYAATPTGKRHKGESDKDYGERVEHDSQQLATASDGRNLCLNPEAGAPDPHFRTLEVWVRRSRFGIQTEVAAVGCRRELLESCSTLSP